MAIVRRIYFSEFKEIVVPTPSGEYEDFRRGEDYAVVGPNNRRLFNTYPLDDWGFVIDGQRIYRDKTKDANGDFIPDYLSLDINNDGVDDLIGNQDFVDVINTSYLLGKIVIVDYGQLGTPINQIYDTFAQLGVGATGTGTIQKFTPVSGWVVLGQSKPSFYYERCTSTYGGTLYSGRIPVSINYFDLDDILIPENPNGTINFVSGEGNDPLQVVQGSGLFTLRAPFFNTPPGLYQDGFDWTFGPELEFSPAIPIKEPQTYMQFFIGTPTFPNTDPNYLQSGAVGVINDSVRPVNLHSATRTDILQGYESKNSSNTSVKPFRGTDDEYYAIFEIPDVINFDDGAKDRWGKPRHAIARGFRLSNERYSGECIPILGESLQGVDVDFEDFGSERKRVFIKDILSGKEKIDGSNYIRGVVTAHFTFPLMSATMQDISDLYYEHDRLRKLYSPIETVDLQRGTKSTSRNGQLPWSEFSEQDPRIHRSDPYTFAREMRSVIYVQDETAAIELLGTDFYSYEGLSSINLLGSYQLITVSYNIGAELGPIKTKKHMAEFGSKYYGNPTEIEIDELSPEGSPRETQLNTYSGNYPISQYVETDTGYLSSRYHFKVGDFIEVYNMNKINRENSKSFKIVNNEYKIIPNDTDDVMQFFEDNGYIKDVNTEDLYQIGDFDQYLNYNYVDLNSIHATENCLIRLKNVAFLKTDPQEGTGDYQLAKTNRSSFMRNNEMRVYNQQGAPNARKSIEYDFGFKFEPGRKYAIAPASDGRDERAVNDQKIFLYNAPSTEMSQKLLRIPGKNINIDSGDQTSKDYNKWLDENKKSLPKGHTLDEYKWPLDIIGIQRMGFLPDGLFSPSYMIMPRSMCDFGICSQNYSLFFPSGRDTYSVVSTGSNAGSSTGGGTGPAKATCFYKDTQVLTPTGTKNIQDILVGDTVMCFDSDFNLHERGVINTFIHTDSEKSDVFEYKFSDGNRLLITKNHPVFIKDGRYVQIGELAVGDGVMNKYGGESIITSIEFFKNDVVYNIETDEFNNYIANDICVHNLTKGNSYLEGKLGSSIIDSVVVDNVVIVDERGP